MHVRSGCGLAPSANVSASSSTGSTYSAPKELCPKSPAPTGRPKCQRGRMGRYTHQRGVLSTKSKVHLLYDPYSLSQPPQHRAFLATKGSKRLKHWPATDLHTRHPLRRRTQDHCKRSLKKSGKCDLQHGEGLGEVRAGQGFERGGGLDGELR